jgi:hypothetical protein
MLMSYNPAVHFFLFLKQWTDCILAGALSLLRLLIFKFLSWFRFNMISFGDFAWILN